MVPRDWAAGEKILVEFKLGNKSKAIIVNAIEELYLCSNILKIIILNTMLLKNYIYVQIF